MMGSNTQAVTGSFNPLKSVLNGNSGEQPVVNCINSLKKRTDRTHLSAAKYIGTSAGVGGKSIEVLSKGSTNTSSQTTADNIYNTRFIQALNTVATNVGTDPIVCPAIVWMQGEANQDPADYADAGYTANPVSYQTHDKAQYKAYLLTLKNDMQADIMSTYSQTSPPLFYIYQTSTYYTYSGEIPISQAQYEFAQENDDVVLLNPHYYVPTAQSGGGHLNANGYRWYSEQIAKTMFKTLYDTTEFETVTVKKTKVEFDAIYLDCYVPVAPLNIDALTVEGATNSGFQVTMDSVIQTIVSVTIVSSTAIKIKCTDDLSGATTLKVMYAGSNSNGVGNIRDSSTEVSFESYVDDTTLTNNTPPYTAVNVSGVNYYGKKYPLWNWLSNFNITL